VKLNPRELAIWKLIATEMRMIGEPHFSTEEIETVEKFVAESEKQSTAKPNRKRL
jgi:hypothetical protein